MRPRSFLGGLVVAAAIAVLLTWPGGAGADTPVAGSGRALAVDVPTPNWAPFVGTATVGCTRSNPPPDGWCAVTGHHSYPGAVDFHLPVGTPVVAAAAGTVVFVDGTCSSTCGDAGRWVGIEHGDGKVSRYLHLDTATVRVGQVIGRGERIGTSGISGNATVPHLHYDEEKPLYTHVEMYDVFACHGAEFVRYPDVLGYDTWDDVPYGAVVWSDGDACAGDLFYDVTPWSPFEDEIGWMAAAGVTEGWADGTFRPFDEVTRQALSAWLHRLDGDPRGPYPDPGFWDVSESNPFFHEISYMVATGKATGFPDGSFRPLECVTRQALVAFLYRDAGSPAVTPAAAFADVPVTHPFAAEITWAATTGVANGYGDGTFRPGDCVTRQAAAAFLYRAS